MPRLRAVYIISILASCSVLMAVFWHEHVTWKPVYTDSISGNTVRFLFLTVMSIVAFVLWWFSFIQWKSDASKTYSEKRSFDINMTGSEVRRIVISAARIYSFTMQLMPLADLQDSIEVHVRRKGSKGDSANLFVSPGLSDAQCEFQWNAREATAAVFELTKKAGASARVRIVVYGSGIDDIQENE